MSNARRPAYPVDLEGINNIAKDAFKSNKDTTVEEVQASIFPHTGLTKRERFAMAAMKGLLSTFESGGDWVPNLENVKYCANLSVEGADALLTEFKKEES